MKEEFAQFLSTSPISPPKEISNGILKKISKDLNPSPEFVFFKIGIIHLTIGSITLLFCPQFGFGFLSGMGIMHFFMALGKLACSILCGSFFLGSSTLFIGILLSREEMKVVRKNRFIKISFLGLLSLLIFHIFGELIVPGLAFAWLLGGILGGILSLEAGWYLKKQFAF